MKTDYDGWEHFAKMWCRMYGIDYVSHKTDIDHDTITVTVQGTCKPIKYIMLEVTI